MRIQSFIMLIAGMISLSLQMRAQRDLAVSKPAEIFLSPEQKAVLKRCFKQIKIVRINLPDIYQLSHTQKTAIPVSLSDGQHVWNMVIEEHELRSPDYKREITTDSGRYELPRDACGTFKGYETSDPDSWVRMNIREHSFSAVINSHHKTFYVELLKRFIKEVDENWVLIYTAADIVPSAASCGSGTLIDQMEKNKKLIQPKINKKFGPANDNHLQHGPLQHNTLSTVNPANNFNQYMLSTAATNCRKLEIVTESDYDNYNSTFYRVDFSDMIDNLNNVEPIFLSQYGIKFVLRYQHEWTTPSDPYTLTYVTPTTGGTDRLSQFRDYWNNPSYYFYNNIVKDLGIYYTGINLDGSPVGKAYEIGSMSAATAGYQSDNSYMIVQTNTYDALLGAFYWPTAEFTCLTGHELGHIMGATHVSSTANLMYPTVSTNINWHSNSITEIGNILNTPSCKDLLSSRYVIIPFTTPIMGGNFSGGEIYIQSNVTNFNIPTLIFPDPSYKFEGVDNCNVIGTCTISCNNTKGVTLKIAPCNNSSQ